MCNRNTTNQNKKAWESLASQGSQWSTPVTKEDVARAKNGALSLYLTPKRPVPSNWLPACMKGLQVLCLASGGGQQGPLFAAAGAQTTVFDISPSQLELDRMVAARDGLTLHTVEGDMQNLSCFDDGMFDLIFCPVSLTYIEDVQPVYKACYRVLRNGGHLLLGAVNPLIYLFNNALWTKDIFQVSNKLPFQSLDELNQREREVFLRENKPIEYSHTLEALLGGLTGSGFSITNFYEDVDEDAICAYTAKYFALSARKLT